MKNLFRETLGVANIMGFAFFAASLARDEDIRAAAYQRGVESVTGRPINLRTYAIPTASLSGEALSIATGLNESEKACEVVGDVLASYVAAGGDCMETNAAGETKRWRSRDGICHAEDMSQ